MPWCQLLLLGMLPGMLLYLQLESACPLGPFMAGYKLGSYLSKGPFLFPHIWFWCRLTPWKHNEACASEVWSPKRWATRVAGIFCR